MISNMGSERKHILMELSIKDSFAMEENMGVESLCGHSKEPILENFAIINFMDQGNMYEVIKRFIQANDIKGKCMEKESLNDQMEENILEIFKMILNADSGNSIDLVGRGMRESEGMENKMVKEYFILEKGKRQEFGRMGSWKRELLKI